MKKIVIVLLFLATLIRADYNEITLREFITLISYENNLNILIDENIDVDMDSYNIDLLRSEAVTKADNIKLLESALRKRDLTLERAGSYYVITPIKKLVPNKIEVFKTNTDSRELMKNVDKVLRTMTEDNTSLKYSLIAPNPKNLILTYRENKYKNTVSKLLEQIDVKEDFMNVKMKIYRVSTNFLKELGLNFTMKSLTDAFDIGISKFINLPNLIKFLDSNENSYLISEPSIYIKEGKKALLKDTTTYPIMKEDYTQDNSNYTQTTANLYEDKEIGTTIKLEYLKKINNEIHMNIDFTQEELDERIEDSQIIYSTNQVNTEIVMKGNEFLLASTSREKITHDEIGLPILKDISDLFKYTIDRHENYTYLIYIKVNND